MNNTTYLWDSDLKRNLPSANYESWNTLHRAYTFFKQHAGGIVGEKAKGAFLLAKAEQWAEDQNLLTGVIEDDERAYCYCGNESCEYHEDSDHTWETVVALLVKPCKEYDRDDRHPHMWRCAEDEYDLSCSYTEVLASLGGIMEPTSDYLRTIYAELALEVKVDARI